MWFVHWKQVCLLMVLVCSCRAARVTNTTMLRFVPTNLPVLEGNSGTLTCNISNTDPGVYYIRWSAQVSNVYHPQDNCRVDGPLTNTQEYNVRCINEDVLITIQNVSRDRHGEVWTCFRRILGDVYGSYSTITVKVPITNVRLEPQREYTITKENTPTKFVCITSAGYPKATIRWYNNNKQLTNNNDVSTSSTTYSNYLKAVRSTLTLQPTRADNSSQIHCAANNNGTTWQYSNRTSVIVYYAPDDLMIIKYSKRVQGDLRVIEGNTVDVICTASSFPESNYSWITPKGTNIAGPRLHITNILRTGGGNYTCKATNTMRLSSGQTYQGENSTTFTVLVLYPPSRPMFEYMKANTKIQNTMIDNSLNVVRNDNFTLTCTTDSQPSSSYRWTTTGNLNIQDTNTEKFTTVSIQEDLSLTCTATNIMTETFEAPSTHSATSTISIVVHYPPSTPVVSLQETPNGASTLYNITTVAIIQGDSVKMTCIADSKPHPHRYQWTGPSNGIYSQKSTLVLPNVAGQHKGDYSCTAENNMNRTFGDDPVGNNSRRVEIDILYPTKQPEFYFNTRNQSIHNNSLRVTKGTTFDVECISKGNPVPNKYSWNFFTMNSKQVAEVKSIFNDVNLTCTATNTMIDSFLERRDGTANATLAIKVLYPPQDMELKVNNRHVLGPNNTAYVIEGDNVTLSCNANSEPPPSTYIWSKLPSTDLLTGATGEYSIHGINKNQDGKYKCLVENVINPSFENQQNRNNSKYLRLEVLYPTKIDTFKVDGYTTINVTVSERDNITLVCNVEGKPESHVSILHEGTPLKNATVMSNVNHTVTKVTCVQHGQYACTARNMYNIERPTKYLSLFVRCSPRPKPDSELPAVLTSALNVDTTISFEVLAYPDPTDDGFKWEKEITNGSSWKEVENNNYTLVSSYGMQSNLTLKNVSRSSFGNYRLKVTNYVGTYSHQFVLSAEDKPQAPTNFHHVEELATDSTLTFKWSPGFDGGLLQTFVLHYRQTNSKANWFVQSIADDGRHIMNTTLGFLTSSTMYDVNLLASNAIGNSSAVEITAVQTSVAEVPAVGNRIIPAVAGVAASLVVMCVIVVIIVLYKRRHNIKDSSKMHPGATSANVSSGMYENVFSHRNDDPNNDGPDNKSNIYQNAPDLHIPNSATSSKQPSSEKQEEAAPVPSNMIYENLLLKAI